MNMLTCLSVCGGIQHGNAVLAVSEGYCAWNVFNWLSVCEIEHGNAELAQSVRDRSWKY